MKNIFSKVMFVLALMGLTFLNIPSYGFSIEPEDINALKSMMRDDNNVKELLDLHSLILGKCIESSITVEELDFSDIDHFCQQIEMDKEEYLNCCQRVSEVADLILSKYQIDNNECQACSLSKAELIEDYRTLISFFRENPNISYNLCDNIFAQSPDIVPGTNSISGKEQYAGLSIPGIDCDWPLFILCVGICTSIPELYFVCCAGCMLSHCWGTNVK